MEHLNNMVKGLANSVVLARCRFKLHPSASELCGEAKDHIYLVEREFAMYLGRGLLVMLGLRLRRGLWYMSGWPWSMSAVLKNEAWRVKTLQRFQRDLANWRRLCGKADLTPGESDLKGRSEFPQTSVEQYVLAFEETKGVAKSSFDKVVFNKIYGILQTELVEEINGVQKNRKRYKTSKNFRNADIAFGLTLDSGICHNKHRFEPVVPDCALRYTASKLPLEAFEGDKSKRSLPFDEIVSASPGQQHFSPASNNRCINVADHELLHQALQQSGDTSCVDFAWFGRLLDATHDLALGFRPSAKEPWKYYLACASFDDSACPVWPAELYSFPEKEVCKEECFLLKDDLDMPELRALFDPTSKNVTSCRIEWLAPFNQDCDVPSWRKHLPIAVRAFRKGPWRAVHETAAYAAFWTLPMSFLVSYAEHFAIVLPPGAKLFDVLWALIKKILKLGDQATLDIIHKRLVDYDLSTLFAEHILCCDEAQDVLEEADFKVLEGLQETAKERLSGKEALKGDFKAKASELKKPKEPSKKKLKKAVLPAARKSLNDSYEEHFDISQAEAKTWLPLGASVWRAYTGHFFFF